MHYPRWYAYMPFSFCCKKPHLLLFFFSIHLLGSISCILVWRFTSVMRGIIRNVLCLDTGRPRSTGSPCNSNGLTMPNSDYCLSALTGILSVFITVWQRHPHFHIASLSWFDWKTILDQNFFCFLLTGDPFCHIVTWGCVIHPVAMSLKHQCLFAFLICRGQNMPSLYGYLIAWLIGRSEILEPYKLLLLSEATCRTAWRGTRYLSPN